jgi:hypothetical protein
MPRRYTKKNNEYWNNLSKATIPNNNEPLVIDFSPELIGEGYYAEESVASSRLSSSSGSRISSRSNLITSSLVRKRFKNIDDGLLPWDYSADGVSVRDAIVLSQKAYFNVPVYKSTIDLLSEFSNSEIYFKKNTGTDKSRKFVEAWLNKIKIYDLKDQFFREIYRSGNVFMLHLDAKVNKDSIKAFSESPLPSLSEKRIPVRYIMLNPADIEVTEQMNFGEYSYAKVLTNFEMAKLKNPTTEKEKELFNSLPPEVKKDIRNSDKKANTFIVNKEIQIPLDVMKLHPVFYKKQDYEPLAIPPGYSVLDDINKKMELKKVDQAIARSIENVILLVTMGAEPDKGGINHQNLKAMQDIFKSKSVGRVLVSDYTTKAEFVIPDLQKVMGKEKYEVLNQDIREGLNNILLGESKYADTEIKLKIFLQRIEDVRERFFKDFLQQEVDRICEIMGLKKPPRLEFKRTDALNYSEMQRLIARMVELGILTPQEGMDVIDKGVFPNADELGSEQQNFVDQRKKGFWSPLALGGSIGEVDGESSNKSTQQSQNPTVSAPTGGRPTGTGVEKQSQAHFAVDAIKASVETISKFQKQAENLYKEKLSLKKLSKDKKDLIYDISLAIIQGCDKNKWNDKLNEVIVNPSILASLSVNPKILDISNEHELSLEASSILYHSTI